MFCCGEDFLLFLPPTTTTAGGGKRQSASPGYYVNIWGRTYGSEFKGHVVISNGLWMQTNAAGPFYSLWVMLSGAGERELNVRPACNPLRSASLQETEASDSAVASAPFDSLPRTKYVNATLSWRLIRTTVRDGERKIEQIPSHTLWQSGAFVNLPLKKKNFLGESKNLAENIKFSVAICWTVWSEVTFCVKEKQQKKTLHCLTMDW